MIKPPNEMRGLRDSRAARARDISGSLLLSPLALSRGRRVRGARGWLCDRRVNLPSQNPEYFERCRPARGSGLLTNRRHGDHRDETDMNDRDAQRDAGNERMARP